MEEIDLSEKKIVTSIRVINLAADIVDKVYNKNIDSDVIKWGNCNDFPDDVLFLYWNSPTQGSIINKQVKLAGGQDITFSTPEATEYAKKINFTEVFYRTLLDFFLYNCFTIRIVGKQFDTKIFSFEYQDTSLIRLDSNDEIIHISSDWQAYDSEVISERRFVEIKDVDDSGYYFYKKDLPGLAYYPKPSWFSGFKPIKNEVDIIDALDAYINNSFVPSYAVEIDADISDEEMVILETNIKSMVGPKKFGKVLILPRQGEKGARFTPMSTNLDPTALKGFLDIARENIMISNSLTSPVILGLPGGSSLGGDGNTIDIAFKTYFNSEILPVQNIVKSVFEVLFEKAGFPTEILIQNNLETTTN